MLPATTALPIPDASGYTQEPAEGALRQGMKGLRVQALQAKLLTLGYDVGTADGLFGAKTKAAVQKFQTDKGLVADGIVGPLTQARAGLASGRSSWPPLLASRRAVGADLQLHAVGIAEEQRPLRAELLDLADLGARRGQAVAQALQHLEGLHGQARSGRSPLGHPGGAGHR